MNNTSLQDEEDSLNFETLLSNVSTSQKSTNSQTNIFFNNEEEKITLDFQKIEKEIKELKKSIKATYINIKLYK